MADVKKLLKSKLAKENFDKLMALGNPKLHRFIAEAVELTKPASVFVCSDTKAEFDYIRQKAVETGEEKQLKTPGHTVHFDGYFDQARDPARTKYLLPAGVDLGERINSTDKEAGTKEILGLFKNSMVGREMLVCFFCLGPTNSEFSILCAQITDSAYVAHSETILFRPGYEQFGKICSSEDFFRFLHSSGKVENAVSTDVQNRRVYMDLEDNIVYSVNTQYGGNTIGLKKLALRLAINRASNEGWLAEHMFVMGVRGPKDRVTYFTGAFPSACGKTSTAMIPGQTIIGDDIAYFRKKSGEIRCVNVEQGIFGIIQDVNPTDDPIIYKAITTPREVIFGNVLVTDDLMPHWLGMGKTLPTEGTNHAGKWHKGMKGPDGKEVTPSHKNARYTVRIADLENRDTRINDPEGVPVGGIFYGGRDSDTCVPVEEAFDWTEGIITKGATLESETTAATLGAEGVRKFDLMSNLQFVSVPLGKYIKCNLDFVKGIDRPPKIFGVNYFLRDKDGKYLNSMADKKVWLLWAELRVNGDVDAIKTPTGLIPKFKDLKKLFADGLGIDYTQDDYVRQFTLRTPELLAKFERVEKIYREKVPDTPQILYDTFAVVRQRLKKVQSRHGEYISPLALVPQ
jgi:phosphoenolpyruvate carboxykinase (GTP)